MIRKSGQRFSGLVKSDKVDAFAANKANLFAIADKLPGYRLGHRTIRFKRVDVEAFIASRRVEAR